jgi:DNA repair exonuclease SbcCD nuclease subunit
MDTEEIRFGVIGDPHIKRNTIPESMKMVDACVAWVERMKFDFVVVMGDTLDRFGDVRIEPLCVAVDDFAGRLVDLCHVYWLIGNHEMPNNSNFLTKKHPFTAFRRWQGLTLGDTVVHTTIKGVQFTLCPYVPEGRFLEALNTNPGWEQSAIIFCHQTFRGARMGAATSRTGDVWDLSYPKVLSGHIHEYHELQDNITYVGAPMELAYGDGHRTVSSFTLNNGVLLEEREDLRLPRKHHFKIKACEVSSFVPPDHGTIKITVIGTVPENLAIKKSSIVQEWKKRKIEYDFKDLKTVRVANLFVVEDEEEKPTMRYRDTLYNSARKDPDMLELYHTLFAGANPIQS